MRTLEQLIKEAGGAINLLRQSKAGPHSFPGTPEFSNWRDEQRAWKRAALFDQSFHMTDFTFKGPDARRLLSEFSLGDFTKTGSDRARHLVSVNDDGYYIGDSIVFPRGAESFGVIGVPVGINWLAFQAESGRYDVEIVRDHAVPFNREPRRLYRFQLQGSLVKAVVDKAVGRTLDRIPYFKIAEFEIGGKRVSALNHSMADAPDSSLAGFEIFGPAADGPAVKEALLKAGEEFGLLQGGTLAYPTSCVESGWIPLALPGIYSGESMRPFREWLPEFGMEAVFSIAGSFDSANIEDYYVTPWDLGYGHHVKLAHEFHGRKALERRRNEPHRHKVWLRWNDEDVTAVIRSSLFDRENPAKFMVMPLATYGAAQYDQLMHGNTAVGISAWVAYSANLNFFTSMAMVDETYAKDGTELTLVWGEPNGGTRKPSVERHVQRSIRVNVSTRPFA